MNSKKRTLSFLAFYMLIFSCLIAGTLLGSRAVTVISQSAPLTDRRCIVIDAGHGGVDGGATSCSGILESSINLEISLRLDDLLHLLGYQTSMIRTTDVSIHTQGDSIAAKKVSDLKHRVKIVNETPNALLVSIHQNQFSQSRYSGAQVFYSNSAESETLAKALQKTFVQTLNPGSSRQAKKASGIYLMEHIDCTGILVECGFLSNPEEEAKLRSEEYQKKVCCVIASALSNFLDD